MTGGETETQGSVSVQGAVAHTIKNETALKTQSENVRNSSETRTKQTNVSDVVKCSSVELNSKPCKSTIQPKTCEYFPSHLPPLPKPFLNSIKRSCLNGIDGSSTQCTNCEDGSVSKLLSKTSLDDTVEKSETTQEQDAVDSAFEEDWSHVWSSTASRTSSSCHESLSRRTSLLEDDICSIISSKDSISRKSSRESRGGPFSRRGSLLDEEICSSSTCSRESFSRRSSKESRISSFSRRGSLLDEVNSSFDQPSPRDILNRRDSLLEAVLAAKRGGWRGLVRTDSLESGASFTSASSIASDCSCPCDDCLLGISDFSRSSSSSRPKKVCFSFYFVELPNYILKNIFEANLHIFLLLLIFL